MFQRRGALIAASVGAVVLFVGGCGGEAAPKGADSGKPGPAATPSPSAGPLMPELIGKTSAEAQALVKPVVTKAVEERSAYNDVPLAAVHAQWTVCFQTPAAAAPVTADTSVEISLVAPGTPCPAQAGATLRPAKTPSPAKTSSPSKPPAASAAPAAPKPNPKSSPSPAPGPKDVSYKNCAEAKAAGAAPIRRGQPGYAKHLDRDNDGIACDK